METILADRTAEASITEIISAIAGVQALIQAGVTAPVYPHTVEQNLGKAYHHLAAILAKRANDANYLGKPLY